MRITSINKYSHKAFLGSKKDKADSEKKFDPSRIKLKGIDPRPIYSPYVPSSLGSFLPQISPEIIAANRKMQALTNDPILRNRMKIDRSCTTQKKPRSCFRYGKNPINNSSPDANVEIALF